MFRNSNFDSFCAADRPLYESIAQVLDWQFRYFQPVERIKALVGAVAGRVVFTTSFGLEDQALTHLIVESGMTVEFVTLDTGRMFPQTYDVWEATEARYGIRVQPVYPQAHALEDLVATQGINGFRRHITQRKACCAVRKLEPLQRALDGVAGWITGVRAEQSVTRSGMAFVSEVGGRGLLKANPLLDWTRDQVVALVDEHAVPRNKLHDHGFLSIGCAPCTRAVQPGEAERAGRWWWETEGSQECGLHIDADGRPVRAGISR